MISRPENRLVWQYYNTGDALQVDGPDKNVILLNPPMCFTMENAHTVIEGVDKAFTDISSGKMERIQDIFELRSSVIVS